MSTGFIYIVTTLSSAYMQENFYNVPTEWEGCLYFGPCKVPMRRKVRPDDYLFGVSPANLKPRRIVFVTQVEEVLSFRDAYENFPQLRGPEGPIHVKPVNREQLSFPENKYEHIPGAMHPQRWKEDIRTPDLDAFFVCRQGGGWFGRWLGKYGPEVDEEILDFFRTCSIYGVVGRLSSHNEYATLANPIVHRGPRGLLYVGLHLETDNPEKLVKLCSIRMSSHPPTLKSCWKCSLNEKCLHQDHILVIVLETLRVSEVRLRNKRRRQSASTMNMTHVCVAEELSRKSL